MANKNWLCFLIYPIILCTNLTIVPVKVFETRKLMCVALRTVRNSPVHSNGVINYAIAVRLFRTVLRDRLKNYSRYNINYIDIIRLIIERTCLKIVRARKICAPFTATHLSILTMPYVFNSCSFNYNIHYILLQ